MARGRADRVVREADRRRRDPPDDVGGPPARCRGRSLARRRRDRGGRAGRTLLRRRPHAGTLRNRVLSADPVGLAQLRDVGGRRRSDGDRAGERNLEAAPRGVRAAAPGAGSPGRDLRVRGPAKTGTPMTTAERADGPVRELFERIAPAASSATPDLPTIGRELAALAADADYLAMWIERLDGQSGSVPVHAPARGPRLTLVHRPEGAMSAVHSHGTWVAISPIVGVETHRRWRVVGGNGTPPRIELAEDASLRPTEVATLLPPEDVHDHGHLVGRGEPAYVLILLGDDQTRFARTEWDLATGRSRTLRPGDGGRWLASEPFPDERDAD